MTIDGKQVTIAQADSTPAVNRADQTTLENTNLARVKIGLYDVDETLVDYINKRIQPKVTQDGKQIVVPVVYANAERWKSVQKDGVLRDKQGRLQLPIILLRRSTISRNKMNNPMNRYHHQTFTTRWSKRNAYDRFTVQNGIKLPEELISVVIPDYYNIVYEVTVWTTFLAQLNELVEQISFETEDYWGERNKYKFLVSVNEYKIDNSIVNNADRNVKCTFSMMVNAYLLPERMLDPQRHSTSTSKIGFTRKKLVFKETIVTEL